MLADLYFKRQQHSVANSRDADNPPLFQDASQAKPVAAGWDHAPNQGTEFSQVARNEDFAVRRSPDDGRNMVTPHTSRHSESHFASAQPPATTGFGTTSLGERGTLQEAHTTEFVPPLLGVSVNPEEIPVTVHEVPQRNFREPSSVESTKVLRFSNRNTHNTANSIRTALQETLNEKGATSPPVPLSEEYLTAKRHLFFETLFGDTSRCLLPPRFNEHDSKAIFTAGIHELSGRSYQDVVVGLSELWDRLQ